MRLGNSSSNSCTGRRNSSKRLQIGHHAASPQERIEKKTTGEMEAAVCQGVSRFEQDYMGRGPRDIRAYL
ncbi:MAG TPA: hypothetical protein DD670_10075, partial [Planctomycetaceae bacterium]|nr:hypothetical protein [Planctomycetaceae bacterium]